ncbi:MAG: DHA2 family efflux MFS transporter permease subunit [Desulfovibrio sp.]|jgi:EmrB/QacA subfamily drug resistance transporter|nr:DHA2 family efflux MFS transporter permease subunit [Desulfovibrio sp.]
MTETRISVRKDSASLRLLPWLVGIAFFMQMLDGSILNTALPAMAGNLGADPLRMHYVVIAYLLTSALVIPASGFLSDRFGIRRVFILSIAVFTAGSALCAAASDVQQLTAARVLQGVGGAVMVPSGRLAVLLATPRERLADALSLVTLPGLLGPLLGPTLGGVLVAYASWRWIFLINIPVGLLGLILSLRHMPDLGSEVAGERFDGIGFVLIALCMASATLCLEGSQLPLPMGAPVLAVTGLCALAAYLVYALRSPCPLFRPELFSIRNFRVGTAGNFFARIGFNSAPFLTPLALQLGLGYTPMQAGLVMLPVGIGAIAAKRWIPGLLRRFGFRRMLSVNTLLVGICLAAHACIDPGLPGLLIIPLFFAMGAVSSMQFTGMNTVTLMDLPETLSAGGNSLLSAVMQLTMGMGVALAAKLLDIYKDAAGGIMSAFQYTYLTLGALTVLSVIVFYRLDDDGGGAKPSPGHQLS